MLNTVEADAGTPNTNLAFSIPITAAASDTNRMKGNRIRVSRTASSNFPGTWWKPKLVTSTMAGAKTIAATQMIPIRKIIALRIRLARSHAGRSPSFSQVAVNIVVKATDRAPSANRSRSRLGMRNAAI